MSAIMGPEWWGGVVLWKLKSGRKMDKMDNETKEAKKELVRGIQKG